ncbi:MAG: hypothetical protein PGMFKBFP_02953 [Anaerolineales bacterium]|nr:hypothetical protein [Anaerolineales bacterium]
MRLVQFLDARRHQNHQRRVGVVAHQVMDDFERLAVAPLRVVQHQQARRARAQQAPRHRLEQPAPFPLLSARRRAVRRVLGHQARQFMLPQRLQPRPFLPDFGRPQPGDDGREG